MNIEELHQELNTQLSIKSSLSTCETEMSLLEQDENVKRYLRLKRYYEQSLHLKKQNEDDILDDLIKNDTSILEEDIYLCFGRNFLGHPKKIGGYYIEPGSGPFTRLHGTIVSKYQNLRDPKDTVVIPSVESSKFESTHHTIFHSTAVPDEEYQEIRRNLYKRKLKEYETAKKGQKRLVKEKNND